MVLLGLDKVQEIRYVHHTCGRKSVSRKTHNDRYCKCLDVAISNAFSRKGHLQKEYIVSNIIFIYHDHSCIKENRQHRTIIDN